MYYCEAKNLKFYDICSYEYYLGEFITSFKISNQEESGMKHQLDNESIG